MNHLPLDRAADLREESGVVDRLRADDSTRVIVVRDRKHVAELTGEAITTDAIVRAIAAPEAHREAAE